MAEFATLHGVAEAARHYDVPRSTIRGWMKVDFVKRQCTGSPRGRQAGAGRKVTYGKELDLEILQWVLEMRDLQLPVTTDSLSAYAHKFVSEKMPELDFKASRGWAHQFMLRHNLSLR